jgi:hypothetical protein
MIYTYRNQPKCEETEDEGQPLFECNVEKLLKYMTSELYE